MANVPPNVTTYIKEQGYSDEQIQSHLSELKSTKQEHFFRDHRRAIISIFIVSFIAFFAGWYLLNYGFRFHIPELVFTFILALFFSFLPSSNYYFLSKKAHDEHALERRLAQRDSRLLYFYVLFFFLFFFMLYIFKNRVFVTLEVFFISLLILFASLYYLSFILYLSRYFKAHKEKMFHFVFGTMGLTSILLLLYDLFVGFAFILIIFHWYKYTSNDLTMQNATRNLMMFVTSFYMVSFLFLLVRFVEDGIRFVYGLPAENIISYTVLSITGCILFYTHLSGAKYFLKTHYSIVRETHYYGKLYSILGFDARYSSTMRKFRRVMFFVGILVISFIVLFIMYRLQEVMPF